MKKTWILFLAVAGLVACKSSEPTPLIATATPGVFTSAPGESVKGNVKIVNDNGMLSLIFDETFMASGPDLRIYLSVDAQASDYKSLGSLKSSKGLQSYEIPSTVDLTKYTYTVVWCQQFSILFGYAKLASPEVVIPTPTPTPTPTPAGSLSGMFVSAPGESVKGVAKIVDTNGIKSLVFDETFAAHGPDLKVYLSIDSKASDYKSLGSLKLSEGTQTYTVSGSIDLTKYKYVVIWCQQFSVLFGSAELK